MFSLSACGLEKKQKGARENPKPPIVDREIPNPFHLK